MVSLLLVDVDWVEETIAGEMIDPDVLVEKLELSATDKFQGTDSLLFVSRERREFGKFKKIELDLDEDVNVE
jgi:hypothetical protein